jgi:DNA-binding NtrC family response regulator
MIDAPREGVTVLVADDDPYILQLTAAILTRSGYSVLTAPDGEAALQVFQAAPNTVHLVISDFSMPCITGPQLIRSINDLSPSTPTLLMSGTPGSAWASGMASLRKPFTMATFTSAIEDLLSGCDFAKIEREQSLSRSLRRNGVTGCASFVPPAQT